MRRTLARPARADDSLAAGIELVLPFGDSRFLERIELEIAFNRERSNTKFDRKIYGDAGLSFASKTYTRGAEKAHFVFSLLQPLMRPPFGQGHIIAFAEDPNIRGFTELTQMLMMNAVLFGPAR